MVDYAQRGQCRWRLLLEHLEGGAPVERCNGCDNCQRIAQQQAMQDEFSIARLTRNPGDSDERGCRV